MFHCGKNCCYSNAKTKSSEKGKLFVLTKQNARYFKYILVISDNLLHQFIQASKQPMQCSFCQISICRGTNRRHCNHTATNFKYLTNHTKKMGCACNNAYAAQKRILNHKEVKADCIVLATYFFQNYYLKKILSGYFDFISLSY